MGSHGGRLGRAAALALSLGAMPLLSGCSLIFVRESSSSDPQAPPECTQSRVAPLLDFTYAAGAGALGFATGQACSDGRCESITPVFIWFAAMAAIPAAVSGVLGWTRTSDCKDAWRRWCALHEGCAQGDAVQPFR
jgi:hypothetical protein